MFIHASRLFCHVTHAEFLQKVSRKELLVHSMEEALDFRGSRQLRGEVQTRRRVSPNVKATHGPAHCPDMHRNAIEFSRKQQLDRCVH